MINSRKLEDLDADTEAKARQFLDECRKAGLKVLITSTFRDKEQQNALYAQGRTKPGYKVTNVKGGSSQHQFRNAFDIVVLDSKGKEDWDNEKAFKQAGAIGVACGLEWGGNWKGFVDMPHFQNMNGRTLADFKRLYPNGEAPPRQRRASDLTLEQAYSAPKELPKIDFDAELDKLLTPKYPQPGSKLIFPDVKIEEPKSKGIFEILSGFFKGKK
jgi:peptidoglycan L-alanyl-D-glutamate endopeptidase CwlK